MSPFARDPSFSPRAEADDDLGCETKPPIEPTPGAGEMLPDWTQQKWDELVPRLLRLAVSRLGHMSWRGCPRGSLPGTIEPADLVNEAIAKTINRVRPWRPETCSLFQHLAEVIVQEVSHAANSSENRSTLAHRGPLDADGSWPPDIADETPDQEQVALWRSERRQLLDFLCSVDPMIGKIAELILVRDLRETRALCVALAATPSEVANLRKRMKRAVCAYLEEYE